MELWDTTVSPMSITTFCTVITWLTRVNVGTTPTSGSLAPHQFPVILAGSYGVIWVHVEPLYIQMPVEPKSPYRREPEATIASGILGVSWVHVDPFVLPDAVIVLTVEESCLTIRQPGFLIGEASKMRLTTELLRFSSNPHGRFCFSDAQNVPIIITISQQQNTVTFLGLFCPYLFRRWTRAEP